MRGYKEEGSTTTPFDMTVLNELDRFSLVRDVSRSRARARAAGRPSAADGEDIHVDHREYIQEYGDDMPLVKDWTWGSYRNDGSG